MGAVFYSCYNEVIMAEEINRTTLLPEKDAAGLERGLLPVFRLIVGVHLGFTVA